MADTQQSAPESAPETAFDNAIAALDPPLVVVTAADSRERAGCVVGFHSQCSIEPLRYAIWLSRANRTYRVAQESQYLGVHVLSADDRDLGEWFAGHTGDEEDPFAGVEVEEGPGGVPLLRNVPTRFMGRLVAIYDDDEADHVCFIVEPCADGASDSGMGDRESDTGTDTDTSTGADTDSSTDTDTDTDQLRVSALSDVEPGHPA